jgi:hypothetical protein
MKLVSVMNGWEDAPHCWRIYLTKPIRIDRTPCWISVSVFGFAFFFGR